jgi:hypothetical protein
MDYVIGECSLVTWKQWAMGMASFFLPSNWATQANIQDITGDLMNGISHAHN